MIEAMTEEMETETHLTSENSNCLTRFRQSERGQIIVEYVLLLAVAVILAALITKTMISHDPGSPGFVLKAWQGIVTDIGADKADDIQR